MFRITSLFAAALASATLALATPAQADTSPSASLLPCESKDGGYYCDVNDIAAVLSAALDPVLKATCLNAETNFLVCRVNPDNTPYDREGAAR